MVKYTLSKKCDKKRLCACVGGDDNKAGRIRVGHEPLKCVKNGLKAAGGAAGAVACFAVMIVTKGKINPKKK